MTRLLIVRLGSLGDLIHTLPAVAALRRAHPAAEIDWLVDAVHQPFLDLVPVVSSVVALRDRSAAAWLETRRRLRARRYDVAIDFQGLIKSAALARLSGARDVVGFERASLREPAAAWFYKRRVAAGDRQHVIAKNLELAAALGARASRLEFPIAEVDSPVASAAAAGAGRAFAILNPGAAWPNKRWPPDRFGAVARAIADRQGLSSVVIWGPDEQGLAQAVVDASGGVASLAPPTGIPDLVAIARASRLMVSGDTGPLHIAAAVGTPAVALFGPTDPARNGPWSPEDVIVSRYARCDCHYQRRCRYDAQRWCLASIDVPEVVAAIGERLRRAPADGGRS
jgi:lipopolysaccharide heptosyltransferase I